MSQTSANDAHSQANGKTLLSQLNLDDIEYPNCPDVSKYEKVAKIGQGTFGEVFKARNKATDKWVALKKVLMENEKEGFPITALREIRILQLLKFDNLVNLIEICRESANTKHRCVFYLVFDFCDHDLSGILQDASIILEAEHRKHIVQQLLNALYFIHENKVLHRDVKTSNVLLTRDGILKLADFGLARPYTYPQEGKQNKYTNRVVTLWYRPPELLLGERNYSRPIDIWGAGLIAVELWTRMPVLQGATEQEQLGAIVNLCGPIETSVWPGVDRLPLFSKLTMPGLNATPNAPAGSGAAGQPSAPARRQIRDRLSRAGIVDAQAQELLEGLLQLDPAKRWDADRALSADWFWEPPLPGGLQTLLSKVKCSHFEFVAAAQRAARANAPLQYAGQNQHAAAFNHAQAGQNYHHTQGNTHSQPAGHHHPYQHHHAQAAAPSQQHASGSQGRANDGAHRRPYPFPHHPQGGSAAPTRGGPSTSGADAHRDRSAQPAAPGNNPSAPKRRAFDSGHSDAFDPR